MKLRKSISKIGLVKRINSILKFKFPIIYLPSFLGKRYRKRFDNKFEINSKSVMKEILIRNSFGPYTQEFFRHEGNKSQKWTHYFEFYDELVQESRNKFGSRIKILEIGVQNGGSLEIWRKLFGSAAEIHGIDIDPMCNKFSNEFNIHIGSSADKSFLSTVRAQSSYFDLIIDDGSHNSKHQKIALEQLFQTLSPNGIYVIEDIENSYRYRKGGGYLRPNSIIEVSKRFIDLINKEFFASPVLPTAKIEVKDVSSVTFRKGLIVIRKGRGCSSQIIWTH
jgi:cephalosporin hydroxylase